MSENRMIGLRVRVNIPDRPELSGNGFVLAGPVLREGREVFQVDMGDHDNWFPTDWIKSYARDA